MKKHNLLRVVITFILLSMAVGSVSPVQAAASSGVDDLRGRWDIDVTFLDTAGNPVASLPPLILYVNDMRASLYLENTFYAGGCMRSPDSDVFMPLSIRAVYDEVGNAYDATIYSTYVPDQQGGEPFVMRLTGRIFIHGSAVSDDTADGVVRTEFAAGDWSGLHHDRRKTKCPSITGSNFGVQGDVYAHQDLGDPEPRTFSLYEMHTVIVSSGLLVEAPDGSTFVVQEYTDIFSPDVDFIGRFRYLSNFEGLPMVGGTYHFVLLDVFGDPIPGTESTDIWTACNQAAPINLNANSGMETDVTLEWDAAPNVPGEFEPGNDPQIGFYQIGIDPYNWNGSSSFGSNLIKSPPHVIPWAPFEPGSPGIPDGDNYGMSLSEFENGPYTINLYAFSEANPQNGGKGLECFVYDSTESLLLTKEDGNISVEELPENQYKPALHVVPAYPEIHGHNWDPTLPVTIYVYEDQDKYLSNDYLYTETKSVNDEPTWCIAPCFDVSGKPSLPNGILPGYVVTMTNGVATSVVHTTDLVWTGVDMDADTVTGTGTPGSWVEVTSHGPEHAIRFVQVGDDRKWVADFSTPGMEDFEQDVLDLGPGYHGRAIEFEGGVPDDGTLAYWHIDEPPLPFLNVQPDHKWADSGNWAPGTSVTLSFGSYSTTLTTDVNGYVWFDLTDTGIAPGTTISLTDGVITKDVLIVSATFDSVNDMENTATGTAPAGAWLGVGLIDENGGFYWADSFLAGSDGTWSVDFDDYNQDFGAVTDAWLHVFDADTDSTLAHLLIP